MDTPFPEALKTSYLSGAKVIFTTGNTRVFIFTAIPNSTKLTYLSKKEPDVIRLR